MGSRLTVYLRDSRGWSSYGRYGGAYSVGYTIARNGYENTIKRIADCFQFEEAAEKPLSDISWAEAMLVIDLLNKNVFWYEEDAGLYLPRIINALIELTWPGWTAIWCAEGRLSVLQACGIDALQEPISFDDFEEIYWEKYLDSGPWSKYCEDDSIAVTYKDGVTLCWHQFLDSLLPAFSPNSFYQFAQHVRKGMEQGEPLEWSKQYNEDLPDTGIHIDYQKHQVCWWSLYDNDDIALECRKRWAGWTFTSKGDDYRWYEQLTGYQMRTWDAEMGDAFRYIAGIFEDESGNYKTSQMPSNQVLEYKLANSRDNNKLILRALMQMKESGEIPPAKIIDRYGMIR